MDRICSGVNVRITCYFISLEGWGGGHFRADGRCLELTWRAEPICPGDRDLRILSVHRRSVFFLGSTGFSSLKPFPSNPIANGGDAARGGFRVLGPIAVRWTGRELEQHLMRAENREPRPEKSERCLSWWLPYVGRKQARLSVENDPRVSAESSHVCTTCQRQ